MYCKNCGRNVDDTSLYCNNCGARIDNKFDANVSEDSSSIGFAILGFFYSDCWFNPLSHI